MRPAVEAQLDAVVHQPFAVHPGSGAAAAEHVHRRLLQHACPLPLLHVRAVTAFEYDAGDARAVQEPGEQQPGRAAADDADGGLLRDRGGGQAGGSVRHRRSPAGRTESVAGVAALMHMR
jgi:hypothetical protein